MYLCRFTKAFRVKVPINHPLLFAALFIIMWPIQLQASGVLTSVNQTTTSKVYSDLTIRKFPSLDSCRLRWGWTQPVAHLIDVSQYARRLGSVGHRIMKISMMKFFQKSVFFLSSFQVSRLVIGLHEKLCIIYHTQTRTGTLRSMRTLASHHLAPVLIALLEFPLPLDQ